MDDPRQRRGDHTWDIVIDYESCPNCSYIIENRQKYERKGKIYQKDFVCKRCGHNFTVTKTRSEVLTHLFETSI